MGAAVGISLIISILILQHFGSPQPDEVVYFMDSINRNIIGGPSIWNRITLRCRDQNTLADQRDAVFFLNDSVIPFPTFTIRDGVITFTINRSREGNYTCGRDGDNRVQSQPPVPIMAYPDSISPEIETSYANIGSTARLDCSLLPGKMVGVYFVTWRNASNTSIEFFKILPRSRSPQTNPTFNSRYSIDYNNFSLYIQDVQLVDGDTPYQCVLGVADPFINPLGQVSKFIYNQTKTANISLSIFKAPSFITQPESQVVSVLNSNDSTRNDVTFHCSVVSSPLLSRIEWRHQGRTVQMGDTKYSIRSAPHQAEDGGMVTESSLIIKTVDGFDSGSVECYAMYFANNIRSVATVVSRSDLSVLDLVRELNPLPLEDGGFVFRVTLKKSLLVPVQLKLLYINTKDQTANRTFFSQLSYFNASLINHLSSRDRVPYDSFRLQVGLVHKDLEGPPFVDNNTIKRAGRDPFKIATWVLLCVTLITIILLLIFIIILLLWRKRQQSLPVERVIRQRVDCQYNIIDKSCCTMKQEVIRCRPDSGEEKVGDYTDERAKLYVGVIKEAIDAVKNNRLMKPHLQTLIGELSKDPALSCS